MKSQISSSGDFEVVSVRGSILGCWSLFVSLRKTNKGGIAFEELAAEPA